MYRLAPAVLLSLVACTRANPAFDANKGLGEDGNTTDVFSEGDTAADGEGEVDSGDGDSGEVDTGDGDSGEVDTGDGDSGDGDSGDGDSGDGDSNTGDGDGDSTTGDGDCDPEPDGIEHFAFHISSLGWLESSGAPNFALAPENCHMVVVCPADQEVCDGEEFYLVKAFSQGEVFVGSGVKPATALQMRFQPGGAPCEGNTLNLDPSQQLSLSYWNGQAEDTLSVRLPCYSSYNKPIYIDTEGSTFWDPDLSEPAALWP